MTAAEFFLVFFFGVTGAIVLLVVIGFVMSASRLFCRLRGHPVGVYWGPEPTPVRMWGGCNCGECSVTIRRNVIHVPPGIDQPTFLRIAA
jgi:hypothetical protein